MGSPILDVKDLHKSFGALKVTDGVSLDLRAMECHALIGPNGAGKTTLINQLFGTLRPSSGTIWFNGKDVTGDSVAARARQGFGRTYQITSIIPGFSVLENVALAAQAHDGTSLRFFRAARLEDELNEKAMAALSMFGLEGRAGEKAANISHGESRLLELAIAVVAEPKLLLLDEPMAGLGKTESEALTHTLSQLKSSVPMLLVEHDMDAVFALADRVSLLVEGRVVASGSPDAVRNDPNARAAYLGEDDALSGAPAVSKAAMEAP
ncbi:MAG: ABC transporter ATP-binding protein [Pseudomonadota bacterium]